MRISRGILVVGFAFVLLALLLSVALNVRLLAIKKAALKTDLVLCLRISNSLASGDEDRVNDIVNKLIAGKLMTLESIEASVLNVFLVEYRSPSAKYLDELLDVWRSQSVGDS